MPSKDKVIWCDRGWMPFYYGFCPSETAWRKEMKKMGCEGEPYPTGDGRTTTFERDSELCVIVTVNVREGVSEDAVLGMLVHETVHVKQYLMRHIGESKPSEEFEAYTMQAIFMCLMDAYAKTR